MVSKDEIDKLKSDINSLKYFEINELKLEITDLKNQFSTRSEIEFICEINEFSKFFKSNQYFESERFYCQGILWKLTFENKKKDHKFGL